MIVVTLKRRPERIFLEFFDIKFSALGYCAAIWWRLDFINKRKGILKAQIMNGEGRKKRKSPFQSGPLIVKKFVLSIKLKRED